MSFLLQEAAGRKKNQSGGRSRFSARSYSNDNVVAFSAVDDNTRIVPGLVERKEFNRGKRKFSQQQVSGNQVMLQRQKRRTVTNKSQKHQYPQQEKQSQQHQENVTRQQQENLGDYTMDRVMQDLQILEQQQQEAKRKLLSAQTTKQKRLDQLRQLNTLLENKNFHNGALRAKLQQSRDFLSIATRELGNRKLTTDRLQDLIADFECKLKRGVESAENIQACGAKIDSHLLVMEHKIANMNRIRMERKQKCTEVRQKYEQTEAKDRELRLAIQDSHKRVRDWGEEKVSLRTQISKLDDDRRAAQKTEQMTELQIQGAQDKLKIEADRISSLKRKLVAEIDQAMQEKKNISSEITAGLSSLKTFQNTIREYEEKIPEYKNDAKVSDQDFFRGDMARIEAEIQKDEHDLLALKKAIETAEVAYEKSNDRMIQINKEASALVVGTKSLTEEEVKRRKTAADFQASLESARAEVATMEESFQEMEETRKSEARANMAVIADYEVEIGQQMKVIEDLKLKVNQEDIALRTKIRLFEETEKVSLLQKLEKAKEKSMGEERKYNDLLHKSNEALIESKLQAEFEQKVNDEATKWETKNGTVISRCEELLKDFPRLQKIDYKFNKDDERNKQIKMALSNLEQDCAARKVAAEAIKEQQVLTKNRRNVGLEATREKLKKKEELQARLKKRQYRKESNRRAAATKPTSEVANTLEFTEDFDNAFSYSREHDIARRRQRRHKKGSDFFDPKSEGDDGMGNDLTPTTPRRLISSFLSQSSGQRVKWADGDNTNHDGCNEEADESDRKQRTNTDISSTKIPATDPEEGKSRLLKDKIGASETEKQTDINAKRLRGRRRSRGASTRSVSQSDLTSLKIAGSKLSSKNRDMHSRAFTESESTNELRNRGRSSSIARKKMLNGHASSTKDSNEVSGSRKYNSKSDHLKVPEKSRNQDSAENLSSRKRNLKQPSHFSTREMTKGRSDMPEAKISLFDKEDKCNDVNVKLSDELKKKEERTCTSRRRLQKEKQRKEIVLKENNDAHSINKSSGTKNKGKENQRDGRNSFTDVDRDSNFLQVKRRTADRESVARMERDSRGRDREKPKSDHRVANGEKSTQKALLKKDLVRKNNGRSSSSKELRMTEKSKAITGKASEKSGGKIRKESSGGGGRKSLRREDKESSNRDPPQMECARGEGTKSSNAKTSSSYQGNGNRKKRKIKGDSVSASSSKTTVTARRRKKRNTGLSQKSTATDFKDESCDFNFQ